MYTAVVRNCSRARTVISLTEELGEPLRLRVVLHGHGAGVEKDHGDDQPEPPLLFAHLSDGNPSSTDAHPKVTRRT